MFGTCTYQQKGKQTEQILSMFPDGVTTRYSQAVDHFFVVFQNGRRYLLGWLLAQHAFEC